MQAVLTSNPSKAEEMAHWRAFVAALPPCSYLATYLADAEPIIERAMADDMTCEPLAVLRGQRNELLRDQAAAKGQLAAARVQRDKCAAELAAAQRDLKAVRLDLNRAAESAATLARCAAEAAAKAR